MKCPTSLHELIVLYKNHSSTELILRGLLQDMQERIEREELLAGDIVNLTLPASIKCNCEIPNRFIILRAFKKIK